MVVPELHEEIYHLIIDFLELPERTAMLRASRAMYLLIAPIIYTTLELKLDGRPLPPSWNRSVLRSTPEDPATQSKPDPLPNLLAYTKHLTIPPHLSRYCIAYSSSSFPNLESLRVIPDHSATMRGFCQHSDTYGTTIIYTFCSLLSETTISPLCPLLSDFRLHKLIIASHHCPFRGQSNGFWTGADHLPSQVKELVVHIGAKSNDHDFFDQIPRAIEKVSIVLPLNRDSNWELAGLGPMRFFSDLAAASKWAEVTEIVGLEGVRLSWVEMKLKEAEECIRVMTAAKAQIALASAGAGLGSRVLGPRQTVFVTREDFERRESESRR